MNYEAPFKSKIKKFTPDETKTWEDRYKALEAHHVEEVNEARAEIERLKDIINTRVSSDIEASSRHGYPWD